MLSPTVSNPGLVTFSEININPQIDQPVTNYYGVGSYGYGTSSPDSILSFSSQPSFSGTATNITHINLSGTTDTTTLIGVSYSPSSDSTSETAFSASSSGDTTTFTGVQISHSGNSTDFNGVVISPSGTGTNYKGISIDGTATYDNAVGVEINLSGITSTSRNVGLTVENGIITQNNANFTTVSSFPALVDSANVLRNVLTIQSGTPITGTDVILNNLAGEILAEDNHSPSALNLGISSVGFVAQVSVDSGKTVDLTSMSVAGLAVPATSTGGTITEAHLYRGVGPLNLGGSLTIDSMYGLKIESGLSSGFATDAWGISVEDGGAENYLAKSLSIGTASKKVTNQNISIEVAGPKTIRLGRADSAQRNALTNLSAQIIYDTDLNKFFGNDGAKWVQLNLSVGDLDQITFTALDNQAVPANITAFSFSNSVTRGFEAVVTIQRGSTYAEYTLKGIQKGASWEMSQDYIGDDTGISFSITAAGQIQYTSTNTGSGATIKFRASTV